MPTFKSNTMGRAMTRVRRELGTMLLKCTIKERDLFHRMYPKEPSDRQLDWACKQIEQTLKNKEE